MSPLPLGLDIKFESLSGEVVIEISGIYLMEKDSQKYCRIYHSRIEYLFA